MVRDKELIVFKHEREQSLPNLYALPGTRKPVNANHLYGHEMDCADVFVSLKRAFGEQLVRWQRRWDDEERKAIGERFGVWPDRIFELENSEQVFFLEVDRGTEELDKQIWPKLQDYAKLSTATPGQKFTVLFTAQGYRYHNSHQARVNELLPMLAKAKRGNQFVVCVHDDFVADPKSSCLVSPLAPDSKTHLLAL
jgi:hypothetical protein